MHNKITRLSYNQLVLLDYFLAQAGRIVTVRQMEKSTPLKKKVLGGVLSALSRTRFRGISLIEPMGKSRDGVGLRWQINEKVMDIKTAKSQVSQLLRSY